MKIESTPKTITDLEPYQITFYHKDELVGTLDFSKQPFTFVGDADESAKVFCETVIKYMPNLIEKYGKV